MDSELHGAVERYNFQNPNRQTTFADGLISRLFIKFHKCGNQNFLFMQSQPRILRHSLHKNDERKRLHSFYFHISYFIFSFCLSLIGKHWPSNFTLHWKLLVTMTICFGLNFIINCSEQFVPVVLF